ncbi:MAG: HD domain-containing protein [Bdellovibrionales bacterium]|jgi:uncharacterized protein
MTGDNDIIVKTRTYVHQEFDNDTSGHDWWHFHRVHNIALKIAQAEKADETVVSLAALLHDIADYKRHNGDDKAGVKTVRDWLEEQGLDKKRTDHVCEIIQKVSFKGEGTPTPMETIEGKVVQDADRLDAIGAIGIARAFTFGGHYGREIYNPEAKAVLHKDFESYKDGTSSTLHHFDEKLLLLKDRLNTPTAQQMAKERHSFMLTFLDQFHKEWEA